MIYMICLWLSVYDFWSFCCFAIVVVINVVVFVVAAAVVDTVVAVIVASVLRPAEIATGCRGMKPALTTIFVIRCHNRMIPCMFHVSLGGKTSAIHPRFSFNMFTDSTLRFHIHSLPVAFSPTLPKFISFICTKPY